MTNKKHIRRGLAGLLAVVMLFSLIPAAFAAQENGYHDPAEHWLTANNRTNELDANAVVTHETFNCCVCGKPITAWRATPPKATPPANPPPVPRPRPVSSAGLC